MTKTPIFKGSGVAIITPMMADGSINFDELGRIIDNQIENKTDSIIICGTTGEASTMNDTEHIDTIAYACNRVNKRVPVIAGTGSNDTHHCIELSKAAKTVGADALLQVTPYYNKTSQKGLIAHITKVCDEVGLPVILYNVPSRTGMNISVDTYVELAKNPLVIGAKEASGNISQIAEIAARCGDSLPIYSGNDDQIVPILSLGGCGVISVLSNVCPKETHDICELYFNGDVNASRDLQLKLLPLINALFSDVNPIPVKAAMNILGWNAGECRLPLVSMDTNKELALKDIMKKFNCKL